MTAVCAVDTMTAVCVQQHVPFPVLLFSAVSRSVVSRSVWPITALKPFPSLLASRVEAEVSGL